MDGLVVGLAQAAALMPGVSRNGATLTAARARGFDRRAAQELSWTAAFPVILGASALKGGQSRRPGLGRQARAAIAAGGVSSFVSTLLSATADAPPGLPGAAAGGHSRSTACSSRCSSSHACDAAGRLNDAHSGR